MKPKKSLGQNFLTDTSVLATIIETANLMGDEVVVEVGGGDGALTRALNSKVMSSQGAKKGQILALELDYRLIEKLRGEFKNSKSVKIIHQDAMILDWEGLPQGYVVVANIPYQITSPLINLWTTLLTNQPASMTLMVQKEVAERLTAQPGSSDRGLTTILVELYGEVHYIQTVPAKAFYPVPKVDSAIINIKRRDLLGSGDLGSPEVEEERRTIIKIAERSFDFAQDKFCNKEAIIKVAKFGFSSKRRTLENSLSGSLRLPKSTVHAILVEAKISVSLRAEDLSIQNWIQLTEILQCQIHKTNQ